jgi:hypothetical protein
VSHADTDAHVSERLGEHLEGDLSLAEFALIDAHLERCKECATELRELRATIALLRGLPDPEPPADLTARVVQRIEAGETRRASKVVALVRRAREPRFAAALAAGFAGLLAVTSLNLSSGDFLGTPSGTSPEQLVLLGDLGSAANVRAMGARRPLPLPRTLVANTPGPGSFRTSRSLGGPLRASGPAGFGVFGNAAPEVPQRDLDGELEALMQDPAAFVERFRRTAEASRRSMIAPLVEYSARRGDGAAVARYASAAARPLAVPASAGR